ncbi:MAG: esterase-like activity of phytase family protein, partial [Desulfobacterota bacterium]|nr:esterase-like activity of phytase family protein [Thermodesulfobacteriota bacterium]
NRGFEGITIAPNGKVYAAVQSVLDINGETSKKALFTRIIELDPTTGNVRTFAYPIDPVYKSAKDAKIGELCAISNAKMLVIEQGKDKNGVMRNLIYLADLANATDITGMLIGGKEPEYVTKASDLAAAGITIASKSLVVDLRSLGWTYEKAEGLSILSDMKTLAVINDNDFGIKLVTKDGSNTEVSITDYTLLGDGTFVDKNCNPVVLTNSIEPNNEPVELWLIELANPLP